MSGIKAGVVVITEFCQPGSSLFKGYINYLDRDEAVRNVHTEDYNIYQNYMGNPIKTTGLFSNVKNELTENEKQKMKSIFSQAQKNGSLMWQTVISFDNRWLYENGLYNGYLDKNSERKLQDTARAAVNKMLKKENMENAVWTAAIHLNTDNIHIHIAIVEPIPMRKVQSTKTYKSYEKNGEKVEVVSGERIEVRGKLKLSSIQECKRTVINEILNTREMNMRLNSIIRESIVQKKNERSIQNDRDLGKLFLQIYEKLPKGIDRRKWTYNSVAVTGVKSDLDRLTMMYIEKYHKEDFQILKDNLIKQSELYKKAYGGESNVSYYTGKIDDLYTRMGNAILKEMREFDRNNKVFLEDKKEEIKSRSENIGSGITYEKANPKENQLYNLVEFNDKGKKTGYQNRNSGGQYVYEHNENQRDKQYNNKKYDGKKNERNHMKRNTLRFKHYGVMRSFFSSFRKSLDTEYESYKNQIAYEQLQNSREIYQGDNQGIKI